MPAIQVCLRRLLFRQIILIDVYVIVMIQFFICLYIKRRLKKQTYFFQAYQNMHVFKDPTVYMFINVFFCSLLDRKCFSKM